MNTLTRLCEYARAKTRMRATRCSNIALILIVAALLLTALSSTSMMIMAYLIMAPVIFFWIIWLRRNYEKTAR